VSEFRFDAWRADKSGNILMMFALLLPLLVGAVGAGVDYGRSYLIEQSLQEIADASALAGARQFVIAAETPQIPDSVAHNVAQTGILGAELSGAVDRVSVDNDEPSVTVAIEYSFRPTFLTSLYNNPLTIRVAATAIATGSSNVCVIVLDPSARGSLKLSGSARMTGNRCSVFANSDDSQAIGSYSDALLSSALTCSAGGFAGNSSNYDPSPTTDCPPREDPLSTRTPPNVGACDHTRFSVNDFTGTLNPGVYCDGLAVIGSSDVTFAPGIYVIKGGDMELLGNSRIRGTDVGFYFIGNGADLFMQDAVDVALSAPLAGPMAGILIWADPAGNMTKVFEVASNHVHTLTGTIYLPNGKFLGRATAPVAQSSAYTAIVAKRLELLSNVHLVLNTNYGSTPVPVPGGLAGVGGSVRLRE
jgi:Flp pilus assembly protein TadG